MAPSRSSYGSLYAAGPCATYSNDEVAQESAPLLHARSSKGTLNCSSIDFVRPACDRYDELNEVDPESSTAGLASSCATALDSNCNNDSQCSQAQPVDSTAPSFWSSFGGLVPNGISLTLHNNGSVARDHLASERTFLAYMRTSLAIASSGVALVQLFTAAGASKAHSGEHRLHTYVLPLGATTVGLGLVVLFIGVSRYYSIQAALTKGLYPASRIATGFIAVMLTCLVTVTFAILLSGKLQPKSH